MQMSRREFIGTAALLGLPPIPSLLLRAAEEVRTAPGERVLVVLQLSGGNDGLNMVIPFEEPAYHRSRPTLAIPRGEALPLRAGDLPAGAGGIPPNGVPGGGPGAAEVGFHPRMAGLRDLYREGEVAVIQGVGYPNPSRSHFRAMDIWHTARPEIEVETGWLGTTVGRHRESIQGLCVGEEKLPLALRGEVQIPSLKNLDWLDALAGRGGRELRQRLRGFNARERAGEVEQVRALAATTLDELDRMIDLRNRPVSVQYPGSHLAEKLKWVGQLVGGGFPSRIYYLTHGGFDTHAQQKDVHALLLGQLSEALAAFHRHLRSLGAAERVTVVVFSEFGRRVRENGSLGTDHGCAAPVLLVGGVRGGLYGSHPGFDDLDEGDLKFHTDFRRIYATLLGDVLGVPPEPILGAKFEKLDLVARRARV